MSVKETDFSTASYTIKNSMIAIKHERFHAQLSEFGGQLLSFETQANPKWFWLSNSAKLDGSKAIRGGVPICWPWFGPSQDKNKPQHGYARLAKWTMTTFQAQQNKVVVTLEPILDENMCALPVRLTQTITFSLGIEIKLTTKNVSNSDYELTQAIHTYFHVQDISKTSLVGLDKYGSNDHAELRIDGHIDKIFTYPSEPQRFKQNKHIELPALSLKTPNGQLEISGSGHDSVVVWNPWQDLAQKMPDFDDEGYRQMLCVEMANTKPVILAPEQTCSLAQAIIMK